MTRFLIAGGTGTLGSEFVRQMPNGSTALVIARDEIKLKALAAEFPDIEYAVCDIRDYNAVLRLATEFSPSVVCNFAAMKHVDVCENQPDEALKTNFEGTLNLYDIAAYAEADFVFSSTDKAVEPINAYGMTKALAEKYLYGKTRKNSVKIFRWGNIIGSRGSVIPKFVESILHEGKIRLTDIAMTRFWLTIESAVSFMHSRIPDIGNGIYIPDMKAASVIDVAFAIAEILNKEFRIEYIGIGSGEKLHEKICDSVSSDSCEQYTRQELKQMLLPVVEKYL